MKKFKEFLWLLIPFLVLDFFDFLMSVKFGAIAVFLFWLIETIIGAIKRKNKVIE